MRIVAGIARGRRLRAPKGRLVRPTADRVKEAVFSILESREPCTGRAVLDLFAGAGSLGIEALSRGAAEAVFVESARAASEVIRVNLQTAGFGGEVLEMPAERAIKKLAMAGRRFDTVFLDPPYGEGWIHPSLTALDAAGLVVTGGWVVVEHEAEEKPNPEVGALLLQLSRRYGDTHVALYQAGVMQEGLMATRKRPGAGTTLAVYAGSFDPITNGHVDIIERSLQVFDRVIVAVAYNLNKDNAMFTPDERVAMIAAVFRRYGGRVIADRFTGLLVDYVERMRAKVIVRGLRAVADFEYEFQMTMMNRHLKSKIETIFMMAGEAHFYTSSRLVKEVVTLGGDVEGLVPDVVLKRLQEKVRE